MSRNNPQKQSNNKSQLVEKVFEAYPQIGSKTKAKSLIHMVSQQVSIKTGPYPNPEDYAKYHEVDTNLTDLMKTMVKDEQAHKHKMDVIHLDKEFKLRQRGQWFALIIYAFVIVLGGFAIYSGFEWGGTIIASLGVSGIITQFLKRR